MNSGPYFHLSITAKVEMVLCLYATSEYCGRVGRVDILVALAVKAQVPTPLTVELVVSGHVAAPRRYVAVDAFPMGRVEFGTIKLVLPHQAIGALFIGLAR